MERNQKPDPILKLKEGSLPKPPVRAGRESVRTTFRLLPKTHEVLGKYKNRWEVPYKEVIDNVVDPISQREILDDLLGAALEKVRESGGVAVRKTHVVSRKTLKILNDIAQRTSFSRDDVLQGIVSIYDILFTEYEKRRKANLIKAKKLIDDLSGQLDACDSELRKLLDEDDPILSRIDVVDIVIGNLSGSIEMEIESGKPISHDYTSV